MRNNLPLPRMFLPISSIKQSSSNTDKRIVEIRLDESRAVAVDDGDRSGGSYRYVIWGDSEELS
jgi:hypothetical protein